MMGIVGVMVRHRWCGGKGGQRDQHESSVEMMIGIGKEAKECRWRMGIQQYAEEPNLPLASGAGIVDAGV